jgi:CelD/BcsL family acetyltransferase involved in cellulose biosynthesis
VNFSVVKPAELGEAELTLWRQFQRDDDRLANPFLSPEFIQAKARHLPGHFVAVMQEGARTVGFLPFQRLGQNVANIRAFVGESDTQWDVNDVLRACGVAVFEYEDLVSFQQGAFKTRHAVVKPTPMVDISAGWETWLKNKKSSSRFKRLLRKERNLVRDLGDIEFEPRSNDHAALDRFMDWKSQHFDRTGHANRFANPAYRAMVHDLLDTPTDEFFMSFLTLGVAGRTMAMEVCLNANEYVGAWQTTHDPDPELDKYSTGMILSVKNVEASAAWGAKRIDLGIGANPYKDLLHDYEEDAVTGWSQRPGLASTVYTAKAVTKLNAEKVVERNPKLRSVAHIVYKQWLAFRKQR